MESLSEKIVLVTGGAQGIGKGLARACLQRGASVVITNLDSEIAATTVAELSEHGPIRAIRCDATDRNAVDALFDDVWATEGPVDLAFCNAGAGGMGQILETPMADVHHQFSTNLYSAIHLAQSYIPRLVEANRAEVASETAFGRGEVLAEEAMARGPTSLVSMRKASRLMRGHDPSSTGACPVSGVVSESPEAL